MKNSNKKGFTLVELVVVIAIIGVLAAILVPSMMGYVKKSRLKTANGNAKTAYNTIAEYVADKETQGELSTISNETAAKDAAKDLASNGKGSGLVATDAELLKNGSTDDKGKEIVWHTQWRKTSSDEIIGQYPDAPQKVGDPDGDIVDGLTFQKAE